MNSRVLQTGRAFNEECSWLENAENQQVDNPFHAIIASKNPNNNASVLLPKEISFTTKLWNVDTRIQLPNAGKKIAEYLRKMLTCAEEILFVDPYFDPAIERFVAPLLCYIAQAVSSCPAPRLEYHLKFNDERPHENFCTDCQTKLAPLIPEGISLRIVRWRSIHLEERFHSRYILTNLGGVLFEPGLDQANNIGHFVSRETIKIFLLSHEMYKLTRSMFKQDAPLPVYELIDEITITGTKRS